MMIAELEHAVGVVDLNIATICPVAAETTPGLADMLADSKIVEALGPIVMADCPHPNSCVWNGCNEDCEK